MHPLPNVYRGRCSCLSPVIKDMISTMASIDVGGIYPPRLSAKGDVAHAVHLFS